MDRRQFTFALTSLAALLAARTAAHAECGELTATEFVEGLYQKQARLHAANAPPDEVDFHALFSSDLRKLMQAPRRASSDAPAGPLLHAFFGWGVLPRTEVTVGKTALVSGNHEGPATVGIELKYRGERRRLLVHAVRENEVWLIANIIYDSGKSLVSYYRGIARG